MKKKFWVAGAAACVLAAGILLVPPEAVEAGTLPAGITVGGVDLTGMTGEEADQKIEQYVEDMSNQEITLTIDGNEITTTAKELGFTWTNQEEIEETADRYAGGNLQMCIRDRLYTGDSLRKERNGNNGRANDIRGEGFKAYLAPMLPNEGL